MVRAAPNTVNADCTAQHVALDFGGLGRSTFATTIENHGFSRHIAFAVPDVAVLADEMRGTDLVATFQSGPGRSVLNGLACCPDSLTLPRIHHDLVWHRRQDTSPRSRWSRDLVVSVHGVP